MINKSRLAYFVRLFCDIGEWAGDRDVTCWCLDVASSCSFAGDELASGFFSFVSFGPFDSFSFGLSDGNADAAAAAGFASCLLVVQAASPTVRVSVAMVALVMTVRFRLRMVGVSNVCRELTVFSVFGGV